MVNKLLNKPEYSLKSLLQFLLLLNYTKHQMITYQKIVCTTNIYHKLLTQNHRFKSPI